MVQEAIYKYKVQSLSPPLGKRQNPLLSLPLSSLSPRSRKFKMSESALYIFGLIDGAALLFLAVYFVSFMSYCFIKGEELEKPLEIERFVE